MRGCLLTWAGISLKTAQSNCTFEVTHITDGTVNIAPTCLSTFPPVSATVLLFSLWRKIHYLSQTFFFIKRGQPSISPAITHAITLIILLCLICVILDKNVQTPSGIYFTVTSASLYTFDSILLKPRQQYSVRAIVTDNWHWISQNFKQNAFSRLFSPLFCIFSLGEQWGFFLNKVEE